MIAAGIQYELAGTGPPVICLHGIGGGLESFRPQLDDAAGTVSASGPSDGAGKPSGLSGLTVIAWNMPGYGASEEGRWPPTFGSLSASLGRLIEGLGLGPVSLVGQSIGGMVALEHALRRPEHVSSLVLVATTPAFGGRDGSFGEAFLKERLAPLEAGVGMAGMARDAAPRLVGPSAARDVIDSVERPMAAVSEKTWRGILECLVTFDRRSELGRVTAPCCLIAGGHDRNAPARTMARMAGRLGNAEYHLIERAGHMVNQEDPARVNRIMGEFVRRTVG